MPSANRLQLGPIVGHTDEQSARIWIRVFDEPGLYTLTVQGIGEFQFVSTETNFEFGTAIAIAEGLRANRRHRYSVRRLGRKVQGAQGSFQTMPPPAYLNEMSFAVLSCSDQTDPGAWEQLKEYIDDAQPRFLLMIGDQIYADSTTDIVPHVWDRTLDDKSSEERRQFLAAKYQENWSRPHVSEILANIPCYMMWDDHDIRDGWGSFAPDSATLSGLYPLGAPIHEKYAAYFKDALDVCWHFQMVHNPLPLAAPGYKPSKNPGNAMPFVFQAGRTAIIVVDGRGHRDVWREKDPILGAEQWKFLTWVVDHLSEDIDAVIVATPVPIVSDDPYGQSQLIVGTRTDDVEMFKKGDEEGLRWVYTTAGDESLPTKVGNVFTGLGTHALATAGAPLNIGTLRLQDIDDLRDHWAHAFSRPEQERLIRLAARARTVNRAGGNPRGLLFVGGDLHCGGLFQIDMTAPACTFECLIASGIGKTEKEEKFPGLRSTVVDGEFEVADGIRATLKYLVQDYNFGIVSVRPDRRTAHISAHVVHAGWGSDTYGLSLGQPPGLNQLRNKIRLTKRRSD